MSSVQGWLDPNPSATELDPTLWLRDLNKAQQDAVLYPSGALLVVAGAGSGKTRTLAMRVAHLVNSGADPHRILLLTFTRRAASEMLSRAAAALGGEDISAIWGGTFHSVCHSLLRRTAPAIGLGSGFSLIDRADATELMGLARRDLVDTSGAGRRFPGASTLLDIYGRVANSQENLSAVLSNQFPWCEGGKEEIIEIFQEYSARKSRLRALDFDDLLLQMCAVARSAECSTLIGGMFDHVLVDEFQDVNPLEAEIVRALAKGSESVMAVGDDAQAIFGFRGANARAMLSFSDRFPGAEVIYLRENYRSTPEVLALANSVMSGAEDGYAKDLYTRRSGGPRPMLRCCADEATQAEQVCTMVLAQREGGVALREQAVLFRTAHHSNILEIELRRREIPFVKFGGLKFLEASHVRDFLALMRLIGNPRDELAWLRVIGLIPGAGEARITRAIEAVRDSADGESIPALVASAIQPLPTDGVEVLDALQVALGKCIELAATDTALGERVGIGSQAEILAEFCAKAFPFRYGNPAPRLTDIANLTLVAAQAHSLEDFIADLTLDPPASTSDIAGPPHLDDDYLILSTIHSAKGGEWDVVYLIHAADGALPSDMALGSSDGVEEERRLAYVAVTRARRELHILYPLRFHHNRYRRDDAHSLALPSRFFNDAIDAMDVLSVSSQGLPMREVAEADALSASPRTGLAELWV